ncbi:CLUMA_CG017734, isoform A [Clunio marinus]|uniref:CLUMA_CG017734, isoform A n=1 Tax=Clunio marinus TaxID=568069 RepID=A0A1J1IZS1_9DIPT|nr:CLUMA_CG017734, isoform A [Clunio marinus]
MELVDEEDSHLCIRCNQTIIGLQNYVNHRQRNCLSSTSSSSKNVNVKSSTKPFTANFEGFLNTHRDEKKIENYADFHFDDDQCEEFDEDEDEDDENLEEESEDDVEISSEQKNKSTESEFKQYDYDFFSSLELQCMPRRDSPHSHPHPSSSGNHRILTRKATAALLAQHGDEWIDEATSTVGIKKQDSVFNLFEQQESESDEENETDESDPEVPSDYTRGKWKPGSRPPNNFTGGKWKPESTKIPHWDENESSNDGNLEKSMEIEDSNPPPTHTKGKWVPGTKISKLELHAMSDNNESFWCSFCSRKLASRAIYERHLKSNLHEKRTKLQNELEAAAETLPFNELSSHFQQSVVEDATVTVVIENENVDLKVEGKKKFRSRSKVTCEVCDIKLPVHLLGKHLISHFHYRKMLQSSKKSFDIVLNNFHKIIIQSPFQCQPCKFYFNTQEDFLRHWNSIGHVECCDKKLGEGGGGYKFFCSICKFACSSNVHMTEHLKSVEHQQVVALINRSKPIIVRLLSEVRCDKCFVTTISLQHRVDETFEKLNKNLFNFTSNFICDECQRAFQSALSLQKHKRRTHKNPIFFCTDCEKTFVTADEARIHRNGIDHKTITSRKRMQSDPKLKARLQKTCPVCNDTMLDNVELRDHILAMHPEHYFSCGRCGMKFPLAQEVSRHVRDKVCKFYKTIQSSSSSVEKQLSSETPRESIKFQVTSSDTEKVAESSGLMELIESNFATDLLSVEWRRRQTPTADCRSFSTESQAEFFFHETLHQLPIDKDYKTKIECRFCKKFFGQQSLREHLRQHTNERIFECSVTGCPMSFTRKSNLKTHLMRVHKNNEDNDNATSLLNVCRVCGKKFQSKHVLEQHKFIHRNRLKTKTFPCQLPNCIHIGHNAADARNHLLTHGDEKSFICTQPNCDYRGQTMEQLRSHSRKHQEVEFKFTCEHCDYKTKLSHHLKRHMRVHEMEDGKIYNCPYCNYSCNNSENLRKHVLKTNKHPGKFMYECGYCMDKPNKFKSNIIKEYQSHLQLAHKMKKPLRIFEAPKKFQRNN